MNQNIVSLNNISISNDLPITLIAGPCVLESHSHAKMMVEMLLKITTDLKINFIYKTSYDKANRTSLTGIRGLGLDSSLKIFSELKTEYGINILTDVHNANHCDLIKDYVDIMAFDFLHFVFFQVQYIHYCWKHYVERLRRNFYIFFIEVIN